MAEMTLDRFQPFPCGKSPQAKKGEKCWGGGEKGRGAPPWGKKKKNPPKKIFKKWGERLGRVSPPPRRPWVGFCVPIHALIFVSSTSSGSGP